MILVRIILAGGQVYETRCEADSPLLGDLQRVVGNGGTSGMVSLDIEQGGVRRGVVLSGAQIAAIETEPPVIFRSYVPTAATRPVPYIRIPDFLEKSENEAVIDYAIRKQPEFQASKVEGGREGYRHSQVLMKLDDIEVEFENRIRELLPDATSHFGLDLPAGYGFEMQLTTHGNGGHFRVHNDNGSARTANRFLTYVYYFFREPIAFSGGNLRLYDEAQTNGASWTPVTTFAEIEPANNMLLLFPSGYFHEVMPTISRSDEFAAGRFTLNGWIRTAPVEPAV